MMGARVDPRHWEMPLRAGATPKTWVNTEGLVAPPTMDLRHSTSVFFPVHEGVVLRFQKGASTVIDGGYFRCAWYESDRSFLSRFANSANDFTTPIPAGARWIRVSYPDDCHPRVTATI